MPKWCVFTLALALSCGYLPVGRLDARLQRSATAPCWALCLRSGRPALGKARKIAYSPSPGWVCFDAPAFDGRLTLARLRRYLGKPSPAADDTVYPVPSQALAYVLGRPDDRDVSSPLLCSNVVAKHYVRDTAGLRRFNHLNDRMQDGLDAARHLFD